MVGERKKERKIERKKDRKKERKKDQAHLNPNSLEHQIICRLLNLSGNSTTALQTPYYKTELTLKFPSQTFSLFAYDVLQIYAKLWRWTIEVICQQVIQ